MNLKNLKVSKISYKSVKDLAASITTMSVENQMESTKAAAPYLPRIISAGDRDLDWLADTAAERLDCSFEQSRYYWSSMLELVADILLTTDYTAIDFGYWRFTLKVEGSVASANSALDPNINLVYLAIEPSDELRAVAASIETIADLKSQPFDIKEVFGSDGTLGQVQAGTQALIMGVDLTMGATGEKVEIVANGVTTECPYVAVAGDLNTRIRVTIPRTVTACKKAKIVITAKGKHGHTPIAIAKDNIVVKAPTVIPPTVETMFSPGFEADGQVAKNAMVINIDGANLSGLTKDNVAFTVNGEAVTIPSSAEWTVTDTRIAINNGITSMLNGAEGDAIKVTLTKSGCEAVEFSTTLG